MASAAALSSPVAGVVTSWQDSSEDCWLRSQWTPWELPLGESSGTEELPICSPDDWDKSLPEQQSSSTLCRRR